MQTPLFSKREVLLFLLDNAANINASSENACWRAAWQRFSRGVFDSHGHDGPRIEFQKVCRFYNFSPVADASGRYTLQNVNIESLLAQ